MTDYRELAAAELDKVRRANNELRDRAVKARGDGQDARADGLEAEASVTSLEVADRYIALAALGPAAAPEGDADFTCTACGGRAGIFQGQAGWRHYRPGPPVEVYDPGHEVTGPEEGTGG